MAIVALKEPKKLQEQTEESAPVAKEKTFPTSSIKVAIELDSLCTGTLSRDELRAMRALVAYTARAQQAHETTLLEILTSTFNVESLEQAKRGQFEEMMRYLVNINLAKILN